MANSSQSALSVLIDDDDLMRAAWQEAAQEAGVSLRTFPSPEGFVAEMDSIPRDSTIYVDSNLGNGVRGEDFAQVLAIHGFSRVFLATGYRSAQSRLPSGVMGALGKDPPWNAQEYKESAT